ncbi:MAG: hypothetical protein RIQ89_1235 [Bacteroidota bacterium]
MTFFIALFILLMQFLWKYIDDLVGKGLESWVIIKLLFYTSATLVPLALPLALLLSSIMTFGNLAEHFELTAAKSSGIALQRIMRPLTLTALFISACAFYFSNFILPIANLKMQALLYDVKNQKPALYIKEGIFYSGIDGYVIKVNHKDSDGKTIYDVMIYDHTDNRGNTKLIMAEKGNMVMSTDERYLLITLSNGRSYEEAIKSTGNNNTRPLNRSVFAEQQIRFDLSQFKMTRTNEELFKDNFQMLSLAQLGKNMDSLHQSINRRMTSEANNIKPMIGLDFKNDSNKSHLNRIPDNFIARFSTYDQSNIYSAAIASARTASEMINNNVIDIKSRSKVLFRHEIEWHRKLTLSFACLILFLIGAPLGAIIKKGGLGMPVVISVLFFVAYHIISITGEKMAREGYWESWKGMWLSATILLPIGIFLSMKASRDSAIFDRDAYRKIFKKIFNLK